MTSNVVCAPVQRLCIDARGPDASAYLHSQLSNDIASMVDGESRHSFVLEPTGRIVALVRVTRLGPEAFVMDTDVAEGLAEEILARLNRFRIRVKVEFSSAIRLCAAIRSLVSDVVPDSVRAAAAGSPSSVVVDAWWGDGRAFDVIPIDGNSVVHVVEIVESCSDLELASDPERTLEIARVRAGWPAMSSEIVPGETLVAATGIVARAVSFTKGCYPGQELVERMDSRGSSAPRTLRRIERNGVPGVDPGGIAVGDPLVIEGEEVGRITSIAGDAVLAYVSRGVDLGESVTPAG